MVIIQHSVKLHNSTVTIFASTESSTFDSIHGTQNVGHLIEPLEMGKDDRQSYRAVGKVIVALIRHLLKALRME